ncbi:hypothetical protein F5Y14DRAFT_405656 [Nemania sp. NC0429]|nr:hypothetical protein F5Y14DRAFT_405656 [Nemania sp. NC0429]
MFSRSYILARHGAFACISLTVSGIRHVYSYSYHVIQHLKYHSPRLSLLPLHLILSATTVILRTNPGTMTNGFDQAVLLAKPLVHVILHGACTR